jgi:hypothetical protein
MMLAFPQLASGAMAQMPIERTVRFRARRNSLRDGSVVQLADPDFEERSWDLTFRELTNEEWQALADLFEVSRGRLGTFLFLEPGANLLSWSEKLEQAPWVVSGSASDGQPDPLGGSRGSRLAPGASAVQSLAAPASYQYAASVWLRTSGAGARLKLSDDASQQVEQDVVANGQWKRYALRYSGSSTTDVMKLELIAGAGAALDVYGPQLEAQSGASAYKASTAQGAAFANTRFNQDALVDEASGPNRHDTRIRLIWTPSQL